MCLCLRLCPGGCGFGSSKINYEVSFTVLSPTEITQKKQAKDEYSRYQKKENYHLHQQIVPGESTDEQLKQRSQQHQPPAMLKTNTQDSQDVSFKPLNPKPLNPNCIAVQLNSPTVIIRIRDANITLEPDSQTAKPKTPTPETQRPMDP